MSLSPSGPVSASATPSAPWWDEPCATSLLHAVSELVFLLDADGKILTMSGSAAVLVGEGCVGAQFSALVVGGAPTQGEAVLRAAGGALVPVELDLRPVGRGDARLVVGRDLRAQRALEQSLERTLARYREAQRLAHLGHWELDLVTQELSWSEEIYRLFGLDPTRFGASYEAFLSAIHPDDRELVDRAFSASVAGRHPYQIEHRVLLPDGTVRVVQERGRTTYADDGTPLRSIGTVQDITAARRAEQERERLTVRLAEARKAEALGTLVGGLAHDFNNLLTVILGNTDLAIDGLSVGVPVEEDLRQVMIAARRARDIVEKILLYHRPPPGASSVTQPAVVIGEVVQSLRASLGHRVELRAQIPADLPAVRIAGQALHRVAVNLCSNAATAMPQGGVLSLALSQVQLSADQVAGLPEGRFVCLTVEDTGTGIAPERLGRIFDPYFTTRAMSEGAGLGLSVVYGLVRSHGGQATVESEQGRGTKVSVYLPALS
ncbi:MAG: PAS domain-containing protein [Deltaproteobacteria bacterium]|nr:PAS domain-containing protein [Deltaproteobacteria bacterium]